MIDLTTTFAGLKLKNPIIIGSSGLTSNAENNKKLEAAGAGAIVLKSIFEEQITLQANQMNSNSSYAEGSDGLLDYLRSYSLSQQLELIKDSKKICNIPIIASINCFSNSEWVDYAHKMELAGADAIELNILAVQTAVDYQYGEFEQRHIDILQKVKSKINIPIIMKLGNNLTNPVTLINQLYANGAAAVVLFNRFYQPNIDIEKMKYSSNEVFSNPSDLSTPLRWVAICSATVNKIDYAASGGVYDGASVVKSILAGASAVEICSTIYQNGKSWTLMMLNVLEGWMDKNGYEHISQFKGLMNAKDIKGINMFERTQFLKYFGEKEE
ncbi:MAG: dihydroorotate dehydrogenase-like protein [Bacteroidaceae bacterium]